MFRWRIIDRLTWQPSCVNTGILGPASWLCVVSQFGAKKRRSGESAKGLRAEADRGWSVIDASRHFTKYKAEAYCLQVLHRRQSAGRYAGRLIGLLRPDSILQCARQREAVVVTCRSQQLVLLRCLAFAALERQSEKEKRRKRKNRREKEGKRKRQRERRGQYSSSIVNPVGRYLQSFWSWLHASVA